MLVKLRNPDREVEVLGSRNVRDMLSELQIDPDTVLVIRDGLLLTREERVADDDRIEIRPVISGGTSVGRGLPPAEGASP
jgi:sulfur carrier protein ThiS